MDDFVVRIFATSGLHTDKKITQGVKSLRRLRNLHFHLQTDWYCWHFL